MRARASCIEEYLNTFIPLTNRSYFHLRERLRQPERNADPFHVLVDVEDELAHDNRYPASHETSIPCVQSLSLARVPPILHEEETGENRQVRAHDVGVERQLNRQLEHEEDIVEGGGEVHERPRKTETFAGLVPQTPPELNGSFLCFGEE